MVFSSSERAVLVPSERIAAGTGKAIRLGRLDLEYQQLKSVLATGTLQRNFLELAIVPSYSRKRRVIQSPTTSIFRFLSS